MCGGVAVFDFDNDGRLDIFFTNGAKLPELKKTDPSFYNCLLHQKSDGTFEDVTAKAGLTGEQLDFNFGVAVGDYDNDGYEDLFICSAGRNALYHNNGDGTFTDVTAASGIGGKPPEHTQRRGRLVRLRQRRPAGPDRVQLHHLEPEDGRPLHDGRSRLLLRSAALPQRSAPLVSQPGKRQVRGRDRRSRGLRSAPGKGMGISIADFNDDGWMDVFIANDTEPNSLFINQKNGTFEEKGLELGVAYNDNAHTGSSMGSDAKDFNNDGKVDIFYNNLMGQVWATAAQSRRPASSTIPTSPRSRS